EQLLCAVVSQQQGEAFRRGQQDVGRTEPELSAIALGGVACSQGDVRKPRASAEERSDTGQMGTQVSPQVRSKRLQRRDVKNTHRGSGSREQERVEQRQERGESLPGAGRGTEEHVLAGGDGGPRRALNQRRGAEPLGEPRTDRRTQNAEGGLLGDAQRCCLQQIRHARFHPRRYPVALRFASCHPHETQSSGRFSPERHPIPRWSSGNRDRSARGENSIIRVGGRSIVPELPEVETVVRDLRPGVVGRTVSSFRRGKKKLRRPWKPT